MLFVPGDRPDRFAKAATSGADVIVVDLEDAVAPEAKPHARRAVDSWLGDGGAAVVRINGSDTDWYAEDVAMAAGHRCAVMLPKAHSAAHVADTVARLGRDAAVIALLETAAGILAAAEICALAGVVRAAFGSVDLGAELGISPEDHYALLHMRSAVVLAAAAAGQPGPLDGVTTALSDADALAADTAHAVRLGFGGKLCIHPRQVGPVNAAFTPSAPELAWAARIIEAAHRGVCVVDGRMVDKPVIARANRILDRHP